MVGEDDGTGAVVARLERIFRTKDTLDRKRSAPVARHPFKVLPTDGGIELLIDETEQRDTRIGTAAFKICERDRPANEDVPKPGRMHGEVGHCSKCEFRDRKNTRLNSSH